MMNRKAKKRIKRKEKDLNEIDSKILLNHKLDTLNLLNLRIIKDSNFKKINNLIRKL